MDIFLSFFTALVLTVAIECGLALLFKQKGLVYAVFLCNLLTNPLLNIILLLYYNFISREYYWLVVGFLEISVLFTEAFLIKAMVKYTFRKSLALSLLFNGASFVLGLLFFK